MPEREDSATQIVRMVGFALVIVLVSSGGWTLIKNYLRHQIPHEQLTMLNYRGDWAEQEYRECQSINLKSSTEPNLYCGDLLDRAKMFNVRFNDLVYDDSKPEETTFLWRCRRTSSDPAFSCELQRVLENRPSDTARPKTQPQPQPEPEHQLSDEELEYLRQRNACEQRFSDKGIFEVDGMTVGAACKKNPNRKP